MSDKISRQEDKGRGNFYQIKCVRDVIRGKEARGEDASFERNLLKHWVKYPGWREAGKPLGHS